MSAATTQVQADLVRHRLAAGCSEEGGALLVIVFPKVESRARVLLADPREALRLDVLGPVTESDTAVGAPSVAGR